MLTRRNFIVSSAALAAFAAVGLAGCGTDESDSSSGLTSVRIAFVGSEYPNDLLGVASDQGYLDERLAAAGYEATLIPFEGAGPAINEAFASGEIDIATTGDVPAVLGRSKGIDTALLAGQVGYQDAALMVAVDSDIETIGDLEGKIVATLQGSYMHKALLKMLADNDMDISDVEFVNMSASDAATAVVSGSVDAACVDVVRESALLSAGTGRAILNIDDSAEYSGGNFFLIDSSFLAAEPACAQAFVEAILDAYDFALENFDEAIAILAKSGGDEDALKELFGGVIDYNLSAGETLEESVEETLAFLIDNELATSEFDASEWIDATYYDAALA